MVELILHLLGDYVFQSDWMAQGKIKNSIPALCHAIVYTLPFAVVTRSPLALFVIWFSHFLIDRFRLAKYVVYVKNFLAPPSATLAVDTIDPPYDNIPVTFGSLHPKYRWENCKNTGYPSETPVWLAVWLLIIADNTLHLLINHLALNYL